MLIRPDDDRARDVPLAGGKMWYENFLWVPRPLRIGVAIHDDLMLFSDVEISSVPIDAVGTPQSLRPFDQIVCDTVSIRIRETVHGAATDIGDEKIAVIVDVQETRLGESGCEDGNGVALWERENPTCREDAASEFVRDAKGLRDERECRRG
jgi:hypothetical protein